MLLRSAHRNKSHMKVQGDIFAD